MNKATRLALINSAIAGGLVFAGGFVAGNISWVGVIGSLSASMIVFLTKLKDFYTLKTNKKAMTGGIFCFYG